MVASIDNGHMAIGDWLPLQGSDGGGGGGGGRKGRGAVVVNKLRTVLDEAHVRKVPQIAEITIYSRSCRSLCLSLPDPAQDLRQCISNSGSSYRRPTCVEGADY